MKVVMKGLVCKNLSQEQLETIYYLLYANYGNDIIASSDETRFKFKLFSTIYQHAPVWAKKIEIRDNMLSLTEEDITQGNININNVSMNPSTEPSTDSDQLLTTINQQITNKNKKSKINAYSDYYMLLETDVTDQFMRKFSNLFLKMVLPEQELLYEVTVNNNSNSGCYGWGDNGYLYGNYRNKKFTDIYPDFETFSEDYNKN